jgi:biopolymer transport protein TolQ
MFSDLAICNDPERFLCYICKEGDSLVPTIPGLFLQTQLWDMVMGHATPLTFVVFVILLLFSVFSWTIIFAKWGSFRRARKADARFLRAFRKANALDAVMLASEQFRPSPLVAVFDFGYEEVARQVKSRGTINNKIALERTLQLGTSEEVAKLERNMSWLATTASVSPFIGLFGTVIGIIRAFDQLEFARRRSGNLRGADCDGPWLGGCHTCRDLLQLLRP